jgi:hypothetical protein
MDSLSLMSLRRSPYVVEAVLRLDDGTDPGAPGAAVTVELCGSVEHNGGCRWPHNSELRRHVDGRTFRTIFVAPPAEELEVRARVESALRAGRDWSVVRCGSRALSLDEERLAKRLANTPLP